MGYMKKRFTKLIMIFLIMLLPLSSSAEWFHVVYAEYLYYLAKHSENSYHDTGNKIIIGVYGSTSMYEAAKHMSLTKRVDNKFIQVNLLSSLDGVEDCHIAFIGKSKVNELSKAIELCKKHHVMLSSDIPGSLVKGSDLEFLEDQSGNIKFKISKHKQGVKVSSIFVNMAVED